MNVHTIYSEEAGRILLSAGEEEFDSWQEALTIPEGHEARRIGEAKRLSALLERCRSFSFLRLGDMELTMMLAWQERPELLEEIDDSKEGHIVCGTRASGSPGLGIRHVERLVAAFEQADYVDFHEVLRVNRALLPRLRLSRKGDGTRNPDKWTSYILPLWVKEEFQAFCDHPARRCGIAAAEASLLEWLSSQRAFHDKAEKIWPRKNTVHFHQLRENGRNIDVNLGFIKDDLKEFIRDRQLDTLFLSSGGGAKILCQELAEECGIRAIDFGAMTRALCDLGSDGNQSTRSTHSIHLYRLPSQLVIEGLLRTRPDLEPHESMAKAHAQLIHQLSPDREAYSRGNRQLDLGFRSRWRFLSSLRDCRRYTPDLLRPVDGQCKRERADFDHFCGSRFLTLRGWLFLLFFKIKGFAKRVLYVFPRR